MMLQKKTLIIIGGGAAGYFCAVNAARMSQELSVIILEKSNKVLSKVSISGGGRCNVTNNCFEIPELVQKYPRGQSFLKKTFHWFNTKDTVNWFKERNVLLKVESDGRIFPESNSSQTIVRCLLNEADKYKVELKLKEEVKEIAIQKDGFLITTIAEKQFVCDYLCITAGGYPKATQFEWLKCTDHHISDPVPSLFTFNIPDRKLTELAGLSIEKAIIKIAGSKINEEGPLLITHWGMSGPVVLKLSAWEARNLAVKKYLFNIVVNWLGIKNENTVREEFNLMRIQYASQRVSSRNTFNLPNRLWLYLLKESFIGDTTRWAELTSKQQNMLIKTLTAHILEVKGKTTFKEEFVTCGGIDLSEIDPNTMQSKLHRNLFFAGEIIDVDGITGGFNFQNAWTGGWIAAKSIASLVSEAEIE